jgi:hypothetical protein
MIIAAGQQLAGFTTSMNATPLWFSMILPDPLIAVQDEAELPQTQPDYTAFMIGLELHLKS